MAAHTRVKVPEFILKVIVGDSLEKDLILLFNNNEDIGLRFFFFFNYIFLFYFIMFWPEFLRISTLISIVNELLEIVTSNSGHP